MVSVVQLVRGAGGGVVVAVVARVGVVRVRRVVGVRVRRVRQRRVVAVPRARARAVPAVLAVVAAVHRGARLRRRQRARPCSRAATRAHRTARTLAPRLYLPDSGCIAGTERAMPTKIISKQFN